MWLLTGWRIHIIIKPRRSNVIDFLDLTEAVKLKDQSITLLFLIFIRHYDVLAACWLICCYYYTIYNISVWIGSFSVWFLYIILSYDIARWKIPHQMTNYYTYQTCKYNIFLWPVRLIARNSILLLYTFNANFKYYYS